VRGPRGQEAEMNPLNYFHVHDNKGEHADGESYSIVLVCEEHLEGFQVKHDDAEYIGEVDYDDDTCDFCKAQEAGGVS
jgi:hypothetical protein